MIKEETPTFDEVLFQRRGCPLPGCCLVMIASSPFAGESEPHWDFICLRCGSEFQVPGGEQISEFVPRCEGWELTFDEN